MKSVYGCHFPGRLPFSLSANSAGLGPGGPPWPFSPHVAEVREEQAGRVLTTGQGRDPLHVPGRQAGLGPSPCFCLEAFGTRPDAGCAVVDYPRASPQERFAFCQQHPAQLLPFVCLVCRADWPVHSRAAFLSKSAHKRIPQCPRRSGATRKLASLHPELGLTSPVPVFTCWPLLGGRG